MNEKCLEFGDIKVDRVTKLENVQFVINKIRTSFEHFGQLGLIYLNITKYNKLEDDYGWEYYETYLEAISKELKKMQGNFFRKEDYIALTNINDDNFVIFTIPPRDGSSITLPDLKSTGERITQKLDEATISFFHKEFPQGVGIRYGHAVVYLNPKVKFERIIYRTIRDAIKVTLLEENKLKIQQRKELIHIIESEDIHTYYQPIVDIKKKSVYGYEALSRGPEGSDFFYPTFLFQFAEEIGLLEKVDELAQRKIFEECIGIKEDLHLFVNFMPEFIETPSTGIIGIIKLLKKYNIRSDMIVMEITERSAIHDFEEFRNILQTFKSFNFKVAIDDAGAGYSSLQSIAEIKPDYLKFDMALIRNIDKDLIKQEILKTLCTLAQKINSILIAEGIETLEELETVTSLGVEYAQGFLFAKPGPPFPQAKFP
ncbi:MAG: EAL domain-containing protein [bacterium]